MQGLFTSVITYSQADLSLVPERESFAFLVILSFSKCRSFVSLQHFEMGLQHGASYSHEFINITV
jgi:hypothetical protein